MTRRRVCRAHSPDVDLVFAVFVYCFLLVKPLESTIMSATIGSRYKHELNIGES